MRTGGESGPAVVAGKPDESLIIQALRYDGLEMPPDAPLPESVVNDFVTWIRRGAVDPRVAVAVGRSRATDACGDAAAPKLWSLEPVQNPPPPEVRKPCVGSRSARSVRAGPHRSGRPRAARRRRAAHAGSTSVLRSRRPAADDRGDRRLRRRLPATRPKADRGVRRSLAGHAAVRRALGPLLARRRPLRRIERQRRLEPQPDVSACLALSRLRDCRVQRRRAVRPIS